MWVSLHVSIFLAGIVVFVSESNQSDSPPDLHDPRIVIVKKMALVVEGMPDKELDLTGDLTKLKDQKLKIKEGASYKIRVDFIVQHETVKRLLYIQKNSRKGVTMDTITQLMGNYTPEVQVQSYTTPQVEAPNGLLYRGDYSVVSQLIDDNKVTHLRWDWSLEISKNW